MDEERFGARSQAAKASAFPLDEPADWHAGVEQCSGALQVLVPDWGVLAALDWDADWGASLDAPAPAELHSAVLLDAPVDSLRVG